MVAVSSKMKNMQFHNILISIVLASVNQKNCVMPTGFKHRSEVEKNGVNGRDWVVFTDCNGKPHFINISTPVQHLKHREENLESLRRPPTFWLYTRNTIYKPEELFIPVQNNTNYIPEAPLVVLVAGWLCNLESKSVQSIKNAILMSANRDDNVIIMDWNDMQSSYYIIAANNTMNAAETLKEFVLSLAKIYGIPGSKIHFIGHSLGAHVVGLAGGKLKQNRLILSRVTGLDPARPFFEIPPIFPGISQDAAAFVDVIHTSIGTVGIYKPAGHVDFYPGGGVFQPALCPITIIPGYCEHSSAHAYYEKSLTKKFEAHKCHDYFLYILGLCDQDEVQYLGDPCKPTARGSYYLNINSIAN